MLCRSVEDEQAVGATYCENMDDLLKESDFVMLVVNLTPETTGLIGHRELSLMKPTATLVNISRGGDYVFSRPEEETKIIVKIIVKQQSLVSFSSFHVPGLVVDQDALVKALRSETIRAAALDVTHPEPLPRSNL